MIIKCIILHKKKGNFMYCNYELDKTLPTRFKHLVRKIKKYVWYYVKSWAMSLNRLTVFTTCRQNFKTPNVSESLDFASSWRFMSMREETRNRSTFEDFRLINQMYATYFLIRTWSLHSLKQFLKCNTKEFCLFVCSFSFNSRIFHSFGQVTIADKGLQILT